MSDRYNTTEELLASAPLALAFGADNCWPGPGPAPTCCWYHGVWQYFRLLDLVATPWKQEAFFRGAFRGLAADGNYRRVLIYAMLALLLSAYREEGREPEVTVVDRCETPLFLNRWFAERHGLSLTTRVGDALRYEAEEPYDLICTHSFLGYFSPPQRQVLAAVWGKILRPGGRVVTVQRIRQGAAGRIGFSSEQAARFREKVRLGCRLWPEAWGLAPKELERRAEVYCRGYASHPVTSLPELLGLFGDQGFRVEGVSEEVEGSVTDGGPATPGQGGRVQLVLARDEG